MNVLALIPARSGSKSVIGKNIRPIARKPLIAYSIEHAIKSTIDRTIVSTDSELYAKIAREHGAETPFLRPPEYSHDLSHDIETFRHALKWLLDNEGYEPDLVVHLRPTCPIRDPRDIDKMVEIMASDDTIDCVRSVLPTKENPFKMYTFTVGKMLDPVCKDIPEAYSLPRQALPTTYKHDSSIDVLRPRNIYAGSMHGQRIAGYIPSVKEEFDIDDMEDFAKAELYLTQQNAGATANRPQYLTEDNHK